MNPPYFSTLQKIYYFLIPLVLSFGCKFAHENTDNMEKNIVITENAPKPIGPYSQAVWADNTLYLSGQIALNPKTNTLVMDSIEAETRQIMENIDAVLSSQKLTFGNIVKTSIFLKDMGDFAQVNAVYGTYFENNFPARETVQVAGLPLNVNVEISVIAVK